MAVRIMLVCALAFSAMLAGRSFALAGIQRADTIRQLMDDLQMLRIYTVERLLPVSGALMEMKSAVFRMTGERMQRDAALSLKSAWEGTIQEKLGAESAVIKIGEDAEREISALFEAVEALPRRDHDAAYSASIARLGKYEEQERKNGREKMKLYASLGALAGLAAGVFAV